ncbi:response regulator [Flavobacteriaceae bacterium GF1]
MKKILLVEDDISLRENMEELLDLSGFSVCAVANGRAAIAMAKKEMPDLILCDIMMPEMDGYAVLEHLSASPKTCKIPFVFVSAKTERHDVRKGMDLGADDYLTKPFEEEELLNTIHSRLNKAEALNNAFSDWRTNNVKNNEIRTLHQLKNFFDDHGEILSFKKEESIYKEGDHSNKIYLILKGSVKCYKLDEQGKELITSVYATDEFLGFTSLMDYVPYQEFAVALEDVELAGISKPQLKTILEENQHVSLEVLEVMVESIAEIKKQLLQMAYSSVRKRTAYTLLQFARAMGNKMGKPLKIARSDLAGAAGVATESLIRTLSDFKQEGLIAVENRNIIILDPETLQHIG